MRSFGGLEAVIMDRIWSAGRPLLVRDVQQTLIPERACNTVLTVVDILYRKGWLMRERDGRAYRYRAVVTREDYTAGLMREAPGGSATGARIRRLLRASAPLSRPRAMAGMAALTVVVAFPFLALSGPALTLIGTQCIDTVSSATHPAPGSSA